MGSGIAQVCAVASLPVAMIDVLETALEREISAISRGLDRLVSKGKLTAAEKDAALARVTATQSSGALKNADLIIEGATENIELKLRLIKQIDDSAPADAIIATNTSSISVTQLAAVLGRPKRLIGMHFFNPAPVMALLELIRGLQTSDATHTRAVEFAEEIGKTPVTVKNSPGFAVNRILLPMLNESIFVLQEQLATAGDIDTAMTLGRNHRIGPLARADLIGLDVVLAVMMVLCETFNEEIPSCHDAERDGRGRLFGPQEWSRFLHVRAGRLTVARKALETTPRQGAESVLEFAELLVNRPGRSHWQEERAT